MNTPYGEEMSMSEVFAEQETELARLRRVKELLVEVGKCIDWAPTGNDYYITPDLAMEIKAALEEGV